MTHADTPDGFVRGTIENINRQLDQCDQMIDMARRDREKCCEPVWNPQTRRFGVLEPEDKPTGSYCAITDTEYCA